MRRVAFGLVLAGESIAIASTVIACRQLVGISDNPPEDLTTTACSLPYGTTACASCAKAGCCAESMACSADPACAAYASCFNKCDGDATCWANCTIDHPVGTPDVSALSACLASKCLTQCKLGCGAFAGTIVAPGTAPKCQACLGANACTTMLACATSAACDAIQRCDSTCQTLDCAEDCVAQHGADPARTLEPDGGSGGVQGAAATALSACGSVCEGEDWHCVGKLSVPKLASSSTPYALHFWLKDYSTSAPVVGAHLDVCPFTDLDCATPYNKVPGMSDANGQVALQFQNVAGGGQQFQGIEGYLKISGSGLVPAYFYWGFPLSGTELFSYDYQVSTVQLAQLFAATNVMPDSAKGTLSVATYDCEYNQASGVTVTLSPDPHTQSFTTMGLPSSTTDNTGFLDFVNVPTGDVQVTATPSGLGKASSRVSVTVRAGAITTAILFPTP